MESWGLGAEPCKDSASHDREIWIAPPSLEFGTNLESGAIRIDDVDVEGVRSRVGLGHRYPTPLSDQGPIR